MMTLNDAISSALGGQPINDGLAQYYLATGGSGSNLYENPVAARPAVWRDIHKWAGWGDKQA